MRIAAALLLAVVAAGASAQQSCPTKPIRFILPNGFYNSINIAPHVRSGKLKALAIAEKRGPRFCRKSLRFAKQAFPASM